MADETTATPIAPPAEPATPANDEGFLHSIATSRGVDPEAFADTAKRIWADPVGSIKGIGSEAIDQVVNTIKHPVQPLEHAAESAATSIMPGIGVARALTEPSAAAQAHLATPGVKNKVVGATEQAAGAIPVVGPNVAKAEEQTVRGNIKGALGTIVGTAGPFLLGGEAEPGAELGPAVEGAAAEGPLTQMNRETVTKLQDLGYSNQQITNFNINDIHKIVTEKIPAPEVPAAAPEGSVEAELTKLGGKKVSAPEPVPDLVTAETKAPAPLTVKAEGPDWERQHVAYDADNTPVGSVGYKLDPSGQAQIYGQHVVPELRGQGIAQQLVRSAIDEAQKAGASSFTSDSTGMSPEAVNVWQALQRKGLPIETFTHPNGTPGFKIDFDKLPEGASAVAPTPEVRQTLAERGQLDGQKVVLTPEIGAKYIGGLDNHATNEERAHEIAGHGLKTHKPSEFTDQTAWPDGSTEKRNYFTKTAEHTWQFAPEEGKPVLIRTKPEASFKTEATGDVYTKKVVKPEKIEILGNDDQWHPISSLTPTKK